MSGHTPTPWHAVSPSRIRAIATPNNDLIADVHWRNRDANTAFIVEACNSHDRLTAALAAYDAENGEKYEPSEAEVDAARLVLWEWGHKKVSLHQLYGALLAAHKARIGRPV